MGYEAREDARGDYNAEVAAEARHEFEGELPGIIEGAIEAGGYDGAVLDRAAELCQERDLLAMAALLRRWAVKVGKTQ